MSGFKNEHQIFHLWVSKMKRQNSTQKPLSSKIKKSDWDAFDKLHAKSRFTESRENSTFYFKSILILLLNGSPNRDSKEIGEKFLQLRTKSPDWMNLATELAFQLFPFSSDEERKKIINEKLIAPFIIARSA